MWALQEDRREKTKKIIVGDLLAQDRAETVDAVQFSPVWMTLQDSVQVCVLDQQGKVLLNQSMPNEVETIHRVLTRIGLPERMGIEACCGAAHLGEKLLTPRQERQPPSRCRVNPNQSTRPSYRFDRTGSSPDLQLPGTVVPVGIPNDPTWQRSLRDPNRGYDRDGYMGYRKLCGGYKEFSYR